MAWPVRRPAGLVPPQLSALGRVRPPMRMRSSIMQMPSLGNLRLRQPLLGIGRSGLPSAGLALPSLPAPPQLAGGAGVGVGGVLSGAQRQRLRPSQFALPGRGEGKGGKGAGSYPIPDASHARNALARVAQHGTPAEQATVKAKVKARFPEIGQGGGNRRQPAAPGRGGGDVGRGAGGGKKWIAKAVSKPGALHRQMGVPQGQKIPAKKLSAAASKGGTLGRRARLAQTLKGLNK
jgi:hypothetical protein